MKFIHVFTKELKDKLLLDGYKLLNKNNGIYIFENNKSLKFEFSELDKKQFIFSNTMTF